MLVHKRTTKLLRENAVAAALTIPELDLSELSALERNCCLAGDFDHSVQRFDCIERDFVGDDDFVHDIAFDKIVQYPEQERRGDAVHSLRRQQPPGGIPDGRQLEQLGTFAAQARSA